MRFLLILFFFLTFSSTNAEPKENIVQKKVVKIDTSNVNVREINKEEVKKLSKQKEFIYTETAPETLSLWERFWIWFWKIIGKIFNNEASGSIFKYVIIISAICIITFVTIKLIGADLGFFSKKSKPVDIPFSENLENIHEINFDEQINAAIQNKNYRLAVRLLYLKTLKKLSDKHLINWLPEKTNQAYVLEIENLHNQQEFKTLTNQFEYIWYGEFHLEKPNFEIIQQSFQQFNQKLG